MTHLPLPLRRASVLAPKVLGRFAGASRLVIAGPEIDANRYRLHIGLRSGDAAERLLSPDVGRLLPPREELAWGPRLPRDYADWDSFSKLQYYEIKVRLPSFVLPLVDRGSMAASLEARVPFLDHELVELIARIPPRLKMKRLQEKHILRKAVEDLLPREIAWRPKRGLHAPTSQWLRDPLPEFASALLSDRALEEKGYFRPEAVRQLLAEHRAGSARRGYEVLGVLGVQLWDDLFVQKDAHLTSRHPAAT